MVIASLGKGIFIHSFMMIFRHIASNQLLNFNISSRNILIKFLIISVSGDLILENYFLWESFSHSSHLTLAFNILSSLIDSCCMYIPCDDDEKEGNPVAYKSRDIGRQNRYNYFNNFSRFIFSTLELIITRQ